MTMQVCKRNRGREGFEGFKGSPVVGWWMKTSRLRSVLCAQVLGSVNGSSVTTNTTLHLRKVLEA